ncbi:MAG: acyltransferase family protein [Deltaproteobacteria bacterium]|nr:acyltransferase family protein [Deltaproteobacteria bacterium]
MADPAAPQGPVASQALDLWLDEVGGWLGDWGDTAWEERILAAAAHNLNEFGYDPFGMSPAFIRKVIPLVRFLYRVYFRVETRGTREIPQGRVMFVGNHGGQIPIDGLLVATAMALEADPPRIVRSMVERWVPTLPFVSLFMARCGQVLGDPANSRHLLDQEEAILVFPEGVRGISKTWRERYRLQEFGSGFLRLALETRTPIVPVAILGLEEAVPALTRSRTLARVLGAPSFPITPTFPWLLPLGLLPYPVKVRIVFGEPLRFRGDPDEEDEIVDRKAAQVRDTIQAMLDEARARRGGPWDR